MKKFARQVQIYELRKILEKNTHWGVVTEERRLLLAGQEMKFYRDFLSFIEQGGRMSPEVVSRGDGFSPNGAPSEEILSAVDKLYWARPKRELIQKLIDEPHRTGFHFTCFLGEWFRQRKLCFH